MTDKKILAIRRKRKRKKIFRTFIFIFIAFFFIFIGCSLGIYTAIVKNADQLQNINAKYVYVNNL